jgi:hypothetical protein
MRRRFVAALALLSLASPVLASSNNAALVRDAVSSEAALSAPAIATLREMGPAGLDELLRAHAGEVDAAREGDPSPSDTWPEVSAAIDAVAAQRDAYASGLYWYTDLERAKAAAAASHRPILSLRLLGRLDEELSCANSRYFRAALYANESVSELLRSRFVLHWSSERPAPKITIDMGDGRKLVRTIAGNSVHFVLDADGRPVDALPGLYTPSAFVRELDEIASVAARLDGLDEAKRMAELRRYHAAAAKAASAEWSASLDALRPEPARRERPSRRAARSPKATATRSSADRAKSVAVTKMVSEITLLRALDLTSAAGERPLWDPVYDRVARLRGEVSHLDDRSRALMRRHVPEGVFVATSEGYEAEVSVDDLFAQFERTMLVDTLRNEYAVRPQIHLWLAEAATPSLETLARFVYDDVFRTPAWDPWLGLAPNDVYTGIANGGYSRDER